MSIADAFNSFTKNEKTVLWWKCKKNLTHKQIGVRLNYREDWVQLQMSTVYAKLGWETKDIHWTVLERRLKDEVCPLVPEKLDDWLSALDGNTEGNTPEEPVEGIPVDEDGSRSPRLGPVLGGLVVIALIGGVVYWFLHRPNPVPAPTPTAMPLASPSPNPLPSSTAAAPTTPVSTATTIPPTKVPTPLPTPAFYEQGQPAILRDGVTVTLQSNFVDKNFGGCFTQNPGFVIELLIHNSTGSQFLIRFDPAAFHAQDDSGTTYTLKGAGMYICNAAGPQNYPGRSEEALYVSFAGQIPLSASYIEITADSLSGVRLIFHKLL